jgi:hypothetical protein
MIQGRFRETGCNRAPSSGVLPKGRFPAVLALPCAGANPTGQDASGTRRLVRFLNGDHHSILELNQMEYFQALQNFKTVRTVEPATYQPDIF